MLKSYFDPPKISGVIDAPKSSDWGSAIDI